MIEQEQIEIANSFAALGHKSRVALFLQLLARANSGFRFGELQELCKIPASTLSHHLNEMERGGIIERRPAGRTTSFCLCLPHLNKILTKMIDQCCIDEGEKSS